MKSPSCLTSPRGVKRFLVLHTAAAVPKSRSFVCHRRGMASPNPWLHRRPIVYAHQGGALEAPSSTLFSFVRAVGLGCEAIEMDVHRTRDGVLVVAHDDTVDATANRSGVIAEMTWSELRELDNAYWFVDGHGATIEKDPSAYYLRGRSASDPGFGFARLEDVLAQFPTTFLNFDIKESAPQVVPYEEDLARMLRRFDRSSDVIVASFLDESLDVFRSFAPEIHTSLGPRDSLAVGLAIRGEGPEAVLHESSVALQLPTHFGRTEILDTEFIQGAHERGLAVHAWTIDEPDDMHLLLQRGIDGIISDRPTVAVDVVRTFIGSSNR